MKKIIIGIVVVVLVGIACVFWPKTTQKYDVQAFTKPEDLLRASDLAVVGEFTENLGTWNQSRDPNDPSKESSSSIIEGELISFRVSEVLKGSLEGDTIVFTQTVRDNLSGKMTDFPLYVPVEYGKEYVLFLNYDPTAKVYFGGFYPYMAKVENGVLVNQTAKFEEFGGLDDAMKDLTVEKIRELAKNGQ